MEVHRLLSRSEIRVLHLSGTLTLGSIVFFLVMANTLLLPAVKSLRFRQSICTVNSHVTVDGSLEVCPSAVGLQKHSVNNHITYPCVKVMVTYTKSLPSDWGEIPQFDHVQQYNSQTFPSKENNSSEMHRVLSNQQQALLRFSDVDAQFHDKCFFHPYCSTGVELKLLDGSGYKISLAIPGMVFDCFYDPNNPEEAIMQRTYTGWSVFHSIFWPVVLLLLGLTIFCIIYCGIARIRLARSQTLETKQFVHTKNCSLRTTDGSYGAATTTVIYSATFDA